MHVMFIKCYFVWLLSFNVHMHDEIDNRMKDKDMSFYYSCHVCPVVSQLVPVNLKTADRISHFFA